MTMTYKVINKLVKDLSSRINVEEETIYDALIDIVKEDVKRIALNLPEGSSTK